jgi:hypothetical protein
VLVRRLLFAVALYIPLIGSALAQEKTTDGVLLKCEFKANQVFYQTMDTETKQTMTVMGMNHTQNQKQTFVFSWTPKEQDKDKNWIVVQKIEAVKMNIDLGGNKVEFDSNNPAAAAGNPLGDFFKALVGSQFTLHISPEMKVIKIEGRDDFQGKLIKANPQMEPLLNPAFGAFPPHAVKKGEKWTKDSTVNIGPIGSYVTKYTYTYEGKQDKFDKISVVTDLKYQEPGAAGGGELPFQIKAAKLESKGATGTILFDNEKHRVNQSDTKMKLEGKLTISIGGTNTEVDLVQDQTTTVKTSDTKPGGK